MKSEYLNNKVLESTISRFQEYKKEKKKIELLIEEIQQTIERKTQRNTSSSVDTDKLGKFQQDIGHVDKEFNLAKNELADAFYTLSEHIVRYTKFNLIDEDDAIQEGVIICFEKIDRFDPNRGSKAFNYLTTCIINHFKQLYRTARNYRELKNKYHVHLQHKNHHTRIKSGKEIRYSL